MKKFELTSEVKIHFGRKLYRIKALISFGNVEKGDLGGFVEKEENLSHDGNAWVYGDAWVYGNARVCGNALLEIKTDILIIDPIGSRNDTTTFFKTKEKKIKVKCGCFRGDIDEFEKAVQETHGDGLYAKQYKLAIELAKISILRKGDQ